MKTSRSSTIVTPETLLRHLGEPNWVVIDVRYSLADPTAGRRAYEQGHIPGAVYADLGRDLSDLPNRGCGRHPLPTVGAMAKTFGGLGIDHESQVVAYDARDGMYAARLWWMLRYLGHDDVAVLDGGFDAWTSAGFDVMSGPESRAPKEFVPSPRPELVASASEVDVARRDPDILVVDSRSPDRYRGENETIDPVAGHIPAARNRFFAENVDDRGKLRSAAELARSFDELFAGRSPRDAIIYCGSGVTACHNLLALEIAGRPGARLFPGSWSEWIADPSRPVATGPEP